MLDKYGVTGEVAMDDGRLAGMQVTAEKGTREQKPSHETCPLKENPPTQALGSPQSGQYLCAPAFPGLSGLKKKKKD